jgi:hypothetical protein
MTLREPDHEVDNPDQQERDNGDDEQEPVPLPNSRSDRILRVRAGHTLPVRANGPFGHSRTSSTWVR